MPGPEQAALFPSHLVRLGDAIIRASVNFAVSEIPRLSGEKPLNPYTVIRIDPKSIKPSSGLIKLTRTLTKTTKGSYASVHSPQGTVTTYEIKGGRRGLGPISQIQLAIPPLVGHDHITATLGLLREDEAVAPPVGLEIAGGIERILTITRPDGPVHQPPMELMAQEAVCAFYGLLQIDKEL